MVFKQNRDDIRQQYFNVWQKFCQQQPLNPLEELIARVIKQHPEYHVYLENTQSSIDKDFTPEMGQSNPFLHMGMHIAIHEQITTDRPAGIRDVYTTLQSNSDDIHDVEHKMMACLGESLWQAQRNNSMPDEESYLVCLKKLGGGV